MLAPDTRVLLSDSLRPPEGFVLDRAVATTFSLDLASALAVPLAFAAREVEIGTDPISTIEAVRKVSNRVDIFCQAGQVCVPAKHSDLLSFLEPMVHSVKRPRPGRLFHPKVWLLRYRGGDGDLALRLLIMSRNLTADQSWDTCVQLDGTIGSKIDNGNRAIVTLLESLPRAAVNRLERSRAAGIESLIQDARRARWELPEDIDAVAFHVLGIGRQAPIDFSNDRAVVVSPFSNDEGLGLVGLGKTKHQSILIGRQEDLDQLPESSLEGSEVFVLSPMAELELEEGVERSGLSGLHAKAYVLDSGTRTRLFLGSANATDAAFGGNVEFLVELSGRRARNGVEKFAGTESPLRTYLEPYTRGAEDETDDAEWALKELVRDIASIPMKAHVSRSGAEYALQLRSGLPVPIRPGVTTTLALLTRPGIAHEVSGEAAVDLNFTGLEITQVTPFVAVSCRDANGLEARTVMLASLVNDPESRLDRILAQQVDTPEKFLHFLALLLGLTQLPVFGDAGSGKGPKATTLGNSLSAGVFEPILSALANNQEALRDLERLVRRLESTPEGLATLPPGFLALWTSVRAVLSSQSEATK